MRIYSTQEISNVVEVDQFTVNPTSTTETDPENHSKCSTQTLVTTEDRYHTKNCVNQLEIEIVVPNGQEKVWRCIYIRILKVHLEKLQNLICGTLKKL